MRARPADPFAAGAGRPGVDARLARLVRTRYRALCALLAVLALALRLPTLASRSLWLDETYSAWFAALPLRELWTGAPRYETHPPFYYTLLKGWTALFGTGEAALRSLSVLAGAALVAALPACARLARLGAHAERIALLAGLLLACNAQAIAFAQQARPYALMALTGGAAVFCAGMLVRALSAPAPAPAPAPVRAWPWAAGLALAGGLTMWLHDTGVVAACAIWAGMTAGLLLGAPGPRGPQAAAVGLAGVGALLVWSPMLPILREQTEAMAHLAYWIHFSPRDMKAAWTVMAGARALHYPVALLVLLALYWLWRRDRATCWLLACVLAVPVLALGAYSWLVQPVFLSRLFAWLAAPAMVLAALGVSALRPRWRLPAVAALLAVSAWSVRDAYRAPTEDWRGILARLARDVRPGDVVIAYPNEIQMPVAYYLRDGPAVAFLPAPFPARGLARRYVSNPGAPAIAPADAARVRALVRGHARAWLIERHADLYDPDGVVIRALGACCRLLRRTEGNGADVALYRVDVGGADDAGRPAR